MEIINNIQTIIFENSEDLKNDTYINLQNELMKLHKEHTKLQNELEVAKLITPDGFDIMDSFWECRYCTRKINYRSLNLFFYTYLSYPSTTELKKLYFCNHCFNSRHPILVKTDYKINGLQFFMRTYAYLKCNIPELEGVKYQYLNRKYMNIKDLLRTTFCKERLDDLLTHFGIEIIDSLGIIIKPSDNFQKNNDIIFDMLLKFQQEYSFFEDDCYKEKITLKYNKIKKTVIITKKTLI